MGGMILTVFFQPPVTEDGTVAPTPSLEFTKVDLHSSLKWGSHKFPSLSIYYFSRNIYHCSYFLSRCVIFAKCQLPLCPTIKTVFEG